MTGAALTQRCNLCDYPAGAARFSKDGFDLVQCGACGLWYVSNPPSAVELARLYSFDAGYHADLAADTASAAFHAGEAVRNLRLLERHATSGRLLDVGCSSGLFLKAARERGWRVQGLEYSADSSRIARDVHGLPVKTGELSSETFEPGSFDVLTMWDVIEHVPDPLTTVRNAARLLAPGGLLVIKTPNVDGLYPRVSLRLADRLGFWGHPEPPGHLYQFSVRTLKRLVARAGLEVVNVYHRRIPLTYSFGEPRAWLRSVKWALYCLAFLPLAWLGPFFSSGDDVAIVARSPR